MCGFMCKYKFPVYTYDVNVHIQMYVHANECGMDRNKPVDDVNIEATMRRCDDGSMVQRLIGQEH